MQKPVEIGVLAVGLGSLIFGILMFEFWSDMIRSNFNKKMPLKPGSPSFQQWKATPVPLYMKVYFWNWTNPAEIYRTGYVPSFSEVGPYVFREVHEKVNLTWNDNGTITYRTVKRWFFEPEKTIGSLSDNITSINVITASAAYMTRDMSRFFLYPISAILRVMNEQIWWTKNVSSLLFEGIDNPIQTYGTLLSGGKLQTRFGYFYGRNGTVPDDVINMGTGTANVEDLGAIKFWNYQNKTNFYPRCRKVAGSTAEFWPPNNNKNDPLIMYSPDMCRQIRLYYEEETLYNGIQSYTYSGTRETVDNGTKVKMNKCFCNGKTCPPSGIFDVSKCQQGAPIALSYPHFYNADPSYRRAIRGMNPERSKHNYYVKIEPTTGVQLEVAARMQINVYLVQNTGLSLFKNITNVYIPVLWMDTHIALGPEFTDGLALMLKLILVGPTISYGLIIVGAVLVFVITILHFMDLTKAYCKKRNMQTSKREYALAREENALRTLSGNQKEEIKYVMPQQKI